MSRLLDSPVIPTAPAPAKTEADDPFRYGRRFDAGESVVVAILGLRLQIRDDRLILRDLATGEELGNYVQIEEARQRAEERERQAQERQRDAEERQRVAEERQRGEAAARLAAEERQRQEAAARLAAEERLRELEAELHGLRRRESEK